MTDPENSGVTSEAVAEPQPTAESQEQSNDQEINWQKANETMSEQKRQMDHLEQKNQMQQQQLAVFQNYMDQSQSAQKANSSPMNQIGDDDVITGAEFKQTFNSVMAEKEKQFDEKLNQYSSQLNLMNFKSQYPDYDGVVRETLKIAEQDPQLAQAIQTSSNPHLLAYRLGKSMTPQATQPSMDAQRMVQNAQKPGAISQAQTGSSSLSRADYFLDMSDKDFETHVAKVKRGFV